MKKDVSWTVTQSVSHLDIEVQVGLWTIFNKATEEHVFEKSILEYLPTIAQPPEYDVCKEFLDERLQMMKGIQILHIFARAVAQPQLVLNLFLNFDRF